MHRSFLFLALAGALLLTACSTGGTGRTLIQVNREVVTQQDIFVEAKVSSEAAEEVRGTSVYRRAWDQFHSLYLSGIEEIAVTPNDLPDPTVRSMVKEGLCATLKFRISEGTFPDSDSLGRFLVDGFKARSQPQLDVRIEELSTGILSLAGSIESAHSPSDVGFAVSTAAVCLAR